MRYKQVALVDLLIEQRDSIREQLEIGSESSFIEQRHLIEKTPERAYWHYGYQAALNDVISQLSISQRAEYTAGKPN